MRGYMFRNRWWALIFAGLVLAGATRLVGTGHGDGALEQAIQEVAAQRESLARATAALDRAIDVLMPATTPAAALYSPQGGPERGPLGATQA